MSSPIFTKTLGTYNDGKAACYYGLVHPRCTSGTNTWRLDTDYVYIINGEDHVDIASQPDPVHYETGVSTSTLLTWTAGEHPNSLGGYQVYLGTSWADVNSATTASSVYMGAQDTNSYDPTLLADTTYYWRVDEVNSASSGKGDVWEFSTPSGSVSNPSPAL